MSQLIVIGRGMTGEEFVRSHRKLKAGKMRVCVVAVAFDGISQDEVISTEGLLTQEDLKEADEQDGLELRQFVFDAIPAYLERSDVHLFRQDYYLNVRTKGKIRNQFDNAYKEYLQYMRTHHEYAYFFGGWMLFRLEK